MGSGCTNNSSSKAKGCFQTISSHCVGYQGDPSPSLGICTNDTLTEVLETIIEKLLLVTEGTEVELNVENICTAVQSHLQAGDKSLEGYIQALVDTVCDLQTQITQITNSGTPESYSLVCLTGSSALTSRQQVIQTLINTVCDLKASLNNLLSQINNDLSTTINNHVGNFLINSLSSCGNNGITRTGSGANAKFKFTGMVPYYVPQPYIGPLSWFDSNGVGLEQYGMCGWYIMNGLNGTQNWMGYTFAGATSLPGINSTPLDSRVAGVQDGANIGDKKGAVKHTLSVAEMPSHAHDTNQTTHAHNVIVSPTTDAANNLTAIAGTNANGVQNTLSTNAASANITIMNTGGGQSHENRQPTVYGVWIVRLP